MKDKIDYFKTFCKISKAFGTTLSKKALLDIIVKNAIETMQAKAACLFLSDEEKDVFVPAAQMGISDRYLHAKPLHAKKIVKAILKGGHLAIKDATTDSRVENHDLKKAEGIASILDVPIMVENKAIGILALYTAEPRDFKPEEIEFLSAMADQGGIAIQHANLIARIQKNAQLFLNLTTNINSTLDIKTIFHHLTVDLAEALQMKSVVIRLIEAEGQDLNIVANYGLSDDFIRKSDSQLKPILDAALKGETIAIEDIRMEDQLPTHEYLENEGILSMICVPIKLKQKVIGLINLYSNSKRRYPPDILILVDALAQAGGLAIQNASSYLSLEEDKKNLEEDIWSHRSWF